MSIAQIPHRATTTSLPSPWHTFGVSAPGAKKDVEALPFSATPQWVQARWKMRYGETLPFVVVVGTRHFGKAVRLGPPRSASQRRDIFITKTVEGSKLVLLVAPHGQSVVNYARDEGLVYTGERLELKPGYAVVVMEPGNGEVPVIEVFLWDTGEKLPSAVTPVGVAQG